VRRLSYRRRVACDAKLVLVGRGELFARDVDTGVGAAPSSSFLRTPKWVRLSVAEDVLARLPAKAGGAFQQPKTSSLVIPAEAGGAFQQPKAGHPVPLLLVVAIPSLALTRRSRQRAACAAGVSIGCRRSSHFSFAGPKEK